MLSPRLVIHIERLGREAGLNPRAGVLRVISADPMDNTHAAQGFTQTRWTQVLLAEDDASSAGREALEYLCSRYWTSIYAFLRQRGYRPHDAEDLTQGFLAKILERGSLSRADPAMGRFRTFLLRILKDYLVDERRKREALKRGGPKPLEYLSFEGAEEEFLAEPDPGMSAEEAFDRGWAASLLENAYRRLEGEFQTADQKERFRLLKPFLSEEAGEAECAELAARLDITSKSASVAVYRLRTRYRRLIHEEVLATVSDSELVNEEFLELFGQV